MKRALATLAVGGMLALSPPGTASAKAGEVVATGTCTAASTAKIKLVPENGRIGIAFEVDQNKVGSAGGWQSPTTACSSLSR